MGYIRQRKIYKLVFEDPEMAGLEVRATSVPLGQFVKLTKLATKKKDAEETASDTEELFKAFSDALIGWNLEDESGSPIPATLNGIYAQDFDFVFEIITAWMNSIASVTGPLAQKSSGGGQYLEALMPMESL